MDPAFIIIPSAFFLSAAFYWLLTNFSHQRIVRQYQSLGEEFALNIDGEGSKFAGFVRKEPFASGQLEGYETTVMSLSTGLWETRQSGTTVRISLPGIKESIKLRVLPRGFLTKIAAMRTGFGKEIKSGETRLDEALLIRSNHPGLVRTLLQGEGGEYLLKFLETHRGVLTLQQGVLSYDFLGLLAGEAERIKVREALLLLRHWAGQISPLSESP